MVDFDALQAAGIANARARAPVFEYFEILGFTVEDMAEAERRGRLFGLAGDAIRHLGPPTHSLRTAAGHLGLSVTEAERLWALVGLKVADPDHVELSDPDVAALGTCAAMLALMGDGAAGVLRCIGSAMSRLSEAEAATLRTGRPDMWITRSNDELATARAWREIAELIPRIGGLMDVVHRHHVERPNLSDALVADPSGNVVCGVGFADLSDFTAMTRVLSLAELSLMLDTFSETAAEVVHDGDGRLVKFIGDAVMWVNATPAQLVTTATELVGHPRIRGARLRIRVGLSYGSVLAVNGDYFGTTVNLAARLVAAADAGHLLADASVHDQLADQRADGTKSFTLKGFDEPVTAYDITVASDG